MNRWVQENWVWLLSGVICLAAIVIFAIPVRARMQQRDELAEELNERRDEFARRSTSPHPNDEWIEQERQTVEEVRRIREEVSKGISDQRRDFQTRRFYSDPYVPEAQRQEIEDPVRWLDRYRVAYRELAEQARQIGLTEFSRRTWDQSLPRDEEIADAMTVYWLQKDLVDLLTNNETEMLSELLDNWGTSEVAEPFDLLRNTSPGEPADTFARLHREERIEGEALRDIAVRILTEDVVNFGSADLMEILSEYKVIPEAGAEEVTLWELVDRITSSSAQRNILEMLERDSDWRHLYDYLIDIRTIRLRLALVDFFEASGEEYLAEFLRRPTPEEGAKIRTLITRDWEIDDVIQTLNTIIAVDNRETFDILVERHGTPDLWVSRFNVASISTREGTGEYDEYDMPPGDQQSMQPQSGMGAGDRQLETVGDIYHVIPVELTVDMEFEKLPLLMRRLFLSDWSISIRSLSITRAEGARPEEQSSERDPREAPFRRRDIITSQEEEEALEPEARPEEEWARRARVEMVCEVRWFLPLKQQREQSAEGVAIRR